MTHPLQMMNSMPMAKRAFVMMLIVLCGLGTTWGAESQPQMDADRHAKLADMAMRGADRNRGKIIEAAIEYTRALHFYKELEDKDNIRDAQAAIFWCRKKMDIDELKRFVSLRKGEGDLEESVKEMEAIVNLKVDPKQAELYFQQAEQFARDHPGDGLRIAIHWFEVANRFKGTDLGLQASDRCLQAISAIGEITSNDLLAGPTGGPTTGATKPRVQAGRPDAASEARSIEELKRVWKDRYRVRNPSEKRQLAVRLLECGQATDDDPAARWALFCEAARVGCESEAWSTVLAACDEMAVSFKQVDANMEKKNWLAKTGRNPVPLALLRLLDNPDDLSANETAGLWYVLRSEQPRVGLAMLAKGPTPALNALAQKELAVPTDPARMVEVGDGWYDQAPKQQLSEDRIACLQRAATWYRPAFDQLKGFTRDRVQARLAEIEQADPRTPAASPTASPAAPDAPPKPAAPPQPAVGPITDYTRITVKQWNALKGQVKEVSPNPLIPEIIYFKSDKKFRIVPNPTERWGINIGGQLTLEMDWRGIAGGVPAYKVQGPFGNMVIRFGGQDIGPNDVITAPGSLCIGANVGTAGEMSTIHPLNAIRVKLVPAE
jgi:hypothetical protein